MRDRVTIAPEYQGHGYATEAAILLVGYLFAERGKHRVTASCEARNAASAAVLQRLGMRQEGHLRESTWNDSGQTRVVLFLDVIRPLRRPAAQVNQTLLKAIGASVKAIGASAFLKDARRRHEAWERFDRLAR